MDAVNIQHEIESLRLNVAVVEDSLVKYFIPDNSISFRYSFISRVTPVATLKSMYNQLQQNPIPSNTNIVLFSIGTNNVAANNTSLCIYKFLTLFYLVKKQNKHAKIVVVSILPKPFHSPAIQHTIKSFNKILHTRAKGLNIFFHNVHNMFLKRKRTIYGPDGIHLNRMGYQLFHQQLYIAIANFESHLKKYIKLFINIVNSVNFVNTSHTII